MSQVPQLLLEPSCTQTLLLLLSLLLLLKLLLITTSSKKHSNLPPSPPKLPLIGNLHQIGALPHLSLQALSKKHGPLLLLRLGEVPYIIVSSSEASQVIMQTYDQLFASRPRSKVADVLLYGSRNIGFAPYGEEWRQGKKLVTTHLLTVKKVQSFRLAREEEVSIVIKKLHENLHEHVDMSEILNSFSNDVICHAISGKFFRKEGRNDLFRELITTSMVLLGGFKLEDYFPSLAWMDVFSQVVTAKAKRVSNEWDELLEKVISDHACTRGKDNEEEGGEISDFVDVLMSLKEEVSGLTMDHIKALLMDMFIAGTDTSYLLLEYAMAELLLNEQVMNKLQDEVRRIVPKGQQLVREQDLNDMNYLKAVIKETLRLHPPGPLLIPRECMEDCEIQNYNIPKQARVIINCYAICRDAKYWDAPDEFKPERFLSNEVDFWGKDFQFTPFGAGRRMCPGVNFSMSTVKLMLANLIYHFDWELPGGVEKQKLDMSEVFGLTVRRKEKLLLVPKPYGY